MKCCEDPKYMFGRSPGRSNKYTKMCTVCEYWTSVDDKVCFCCHNRLRIRKLLHGQVRLDLWIPNSTMKLQLVPQEVTTTK